MSSPSYSGFVGGVSAGVLPLAGKANASRLIALIRKILPRSLTKIGSPLKKTQGLQIRKPKLWRFMTKKQGIHTICTKRYDTHGFQEVSIGAITDIHTTLLPDVPIALTRGNFAIETGIPKDISLPILKSAITLQLLTPQISNRSVDTSTQYLLTRLERLKDRYGFSGSCLSGEGVFNANFLGRIFSTIHLARSSARVQWKDKVTTTDMKKAWNHILEPALEEFLEASEHEYNWDQEKQERRLENYDFRIIKVMRKFDSGKEGSFGPSIKEVADEISLEYEMVERELQRMLLGGILYEPKLGHFRFA